jgi:ketosteroid isomerase-like protein
MGQLTFTELSVRPVDRTFTYATGRWQVVMKNEAPHGLFTILLRNTPDGWRIVHDHTSS